MRIVESRAEVHRLVESGEYSIQFRDEVLEVRDGPDGWVYFWKGSPQGRNLEDVLDRMEDHELKLAVLSLCGGFLDNDDDCRKLSSADDPYEEFPQRDIAAVAAELLDPVVWPMAETVKDLQHDLGPWATAARVTWALQSLAASDCQTLMWVGPRRYCLSPHALGERVSINVKDPGGPQACDIEVLVTSEGLSLDVYDAKGESPLCAARLMWADL